MKKLISSIFALFVTFGIFSQAEELGVEEIVKRANLAAYYAGRDGVADVKMEIIDAQERKRIREFRILRMNMESGGAQKFYVYFKAPADVAKMVFMVWKNTEKDDDRWLYLPALDLVRRIASSDKRSSFVGSHFVYEDVSGRGIVADEHELVEVTSKQYKIKNIPKEKDGVEFAYYFVWIDKDTFIPAKAEYYNQAGKLIRVIEAEEITVVEGKPTVTKSIARDLERKGRTTMVFSDIKYDIGLEEEIFAERYLRQAPVKWLR